MSSIEDTLVQEVISAKISITSTTVTPHIIMLSKMLTNLRMGQLVIPMSYV